MEQNCAVLEKLPQLMRRDRRVALAAVRQDPGLLSAVSVSLTSDRSFLQEVAALGEQHRTAVPARIVAANGV